MTEAERSIYCDVDLEKRESLEDSEKLATYLSSGAAVFAAAGSDVDELNSKRGFVVPIGLATDGVYTWPFAMEYYVKAYGFGIPENLASHIRSKDYVITRVSGERLDQIRAEEELEEASEGIRSS